MQNARNILCMKENVCLFPKYPRYLSGDSFRFIVGLDLKLSITWKHLTLGVHPFLSALLNHEDLWKRIPGGQTMVLRFCKYFCAKKSNIIQLILGYSQLCFEYACCPPKTLVSLNDVALGYFPVTLWRHKMMSTDNDVIHSAVFLWCAQFE